MTYCVTSLSGLLGACLLAALKGFTWPGLDDHWSPCIISHLVEGHEKRRTPIRLINRVAVLQFTRGRVVTQSVDQETRGLCLHVQCVSDLPQLLMQISKKGRDSSVIIRLFVLL